jgi:hypothetical protein
MFKIDVLDVLIWSPNNCFELLNIAFFYNIVTILYFYRSALNKSNCSDLKIGSKVFERPYSLKIKDVKEIGHFQLPCYPCSKIDVLDVLIWSPNNCFELLNITFF